MLSSVHSLAVDQQGLWLLSGLESGGINLQSVRHEEGKRITCLRKHTSAVSVLCLAQDELSVLSGSWDKTINDWDLNTGQVKRTFIGNGGQTSAIEMRPLSSLQVPEQSIFEVTQHETFASNNAAKPLFNGVLPNGLKDGNARVTNIGENGNEGIDGSPVDSLFGDKDSLFGDDKDGAPGVPSGPSFGDDDDDEFSRAIANGIKQQEEEEEGKDDVPMGDMGGAVRTPPKAEQLESSVAAADDAGDNMDVDNTETNQEVSQVNGLPHSDDGPSVTHGLSSKDDTTPSSESTFLECSMDGTIKIWDRRQMNPVARILPHRVPPWCMSACWSPDGNTIYAGRRNNCVEEFSLHKGFREPTRTFKFPLDSGPVSAVKAMPNGKHIVM